MEPMTLIEVLDAHGRIQVRHRLNVVGAVCKIGRSIVCDIVLDDSYAAAEHSIVTLLANGRVSITDLGSRNGTRLNGKLVYADTPGVEDGALIVGRTALRIRTAHTQVAPERLFRRDVLQRHKTSFTIAGLLLVLSYATFDLWLTAPDQLAPRLLEALFGVCLILGLWIGMWTLITRISHGAWQIRIHTAIAANAIAIGAWSAWIVGLASYALQWHLTWVTTLIGMAAIIGALYQHLLKATHLVARTVVITAVSIPLMFGAAAGWLTEQTYTRDVNRIALGPDVFPPGVRLATTKDLNDYLAQTNSLKRDASRKRQQSLADMPLAEVGQ
jgi:hypothetical protein